MSTVSIFWESPWSTAVCTGRGWRSPYARCSGPGYGLHKRITNAHDNTAIDLAFQLHGVELLTATVGSDNAFLP